jgi:hypothetical protein
VASIKINDLGDFSIFSPLSLCLFLCPFHARLDVSDFQKGVALFRNCNRRMTEP